MNALSPRTPQAAVASRDRRPPWKLIALGAWLLATYALAGWWLIFGLRQVERLSELDLAAASELARQHRMLMSEGLALFLLLFAGGASLLYYIWVEMRRARVIREFFAAFTHDLKTSLASVRLQAESLEEDLRATPHEKLLRRLTKDTVRLELQLENSLFLSSPDAASDLFIETLSLEDAVARLRHQWPDLAIDVRGRASVRADSRALESILKNLVQNAVVHGKASRVKLSVVPRADALDRVEIWIEDDGRGFDGDLAAIGPIFRRHATGSGSGIGLPLSMRLAKQMGGELELAVPPSGRGFGARLVLPGFAEESAK